MTKEMIMNYINNGKVVFDLVITNDEDANHKGIFKWVLNDKWFHDPVGIELKDDESGYERVFLFNSTGLERTFHGIEGIKKDIARNCLKN